MLGSWRLRRFRAPIVLSILIILALYHFTNLKEPSGISVEKLKEYGRLKDHKEFSAPQEPLAHPPLPLPPRPSPFDISITPPKPAINDVPAPAPVEEPFDISITPPKPATNDVPAPAPVSDFAPVEKPEEPIAVKPKESVARTSSVPSAPSSAELPKASAPKPADEGSLLKTDKDGVPEITLGSDRWHQKPVHYPVPKESIIPLPTGNPKKLPQIQAKFEPETNIDKQERLRRQKSVKTALLKDWKAYKQEAWGRDEVSPITGSGRDTFGGWGATLVDALDTLWIMGLEDEFELALKQVAKIDFTTTTLAKIPVFETTIRYLGGLLGAYDLSDGKYQILLDKAIEIGDVLYGAFDTPNRMPQLYYHWIPRQRKSPLRADKNGVMSELGSLSMEFTRLAQITGNNTYYDAVARVTNAIEDYQFNTAVPGLWPTVANMKECKESKKAETVPLEHASSLGDVSVVAEDTGSGSTSAVTGQAAAKSNFARSLLEENDGKDVENKPVASSVPTPEDVCEAALERPLGTNRELYSLGAMIDSLYEYLIKQYLLLGGVDEADQYKRMYETAMDVVKEKLLFRPQVPNNPDILFTGDLYSSLTSEDFTPIVSHLGCFSGGMFGLGSKALGRTDDLGIALKLTKGCAWAYGALPSGIMPELLKLDMCEDPKDCTYTEAAWLKTHSPNKAYVEKELRKVVIKETDSAETPTKADSSSLFEKRAPPPPRSAEEDSAPKGPEADAKKFIAKERLPPGFKEIPDRKYIMRPEAIESVWYMYRITGDTEWQDEGWRMWEAVNAQTDSELAHSAIADVTFKKGEAGFEYRDELESFWFGETLKYFYLLFSEPDVVSLDDYVLNTEAHPFRRPKPAASAST